MARTKGSKSLDGFERDFLRLMIGTHGMPYGQVAKLLNRPKSSVYTTWQKMEREGTTGQLALPGLAPEGDGDGR